MTVDFGAMMRNQQQQLEKQSNGGSDRPERQKSVININKDATKYPANSVYYRIVPLGDRFFATSFLQVFLTLNKQDGSTYNLPVAFPNTKISIPVPENWGGASYSYTNDEAYQLLKEIIGYNAKMRQENGVKGDTIPLSDGPYNTNFSVRYEVLAIRYFYDANSGTMQPEKDDTGKIIFRGLPLANGAYLGLLNQATSGMYKKPDNTPFGDLGFIDKDVCLPLQITRQSTEYTVTPMAQFVANDPLPADYLDKDANGFFKNIDDPYVFDEPMKNDNEFRNDVLLPHLRALASQIPGHQGVAPVTSTTTQAPAANPYVAQQQPQPTAPQPQAPVAPQAPQAPNNVTPTTTQAPVAPQDPQQSTPVAPAPQAPTSTPAQGTQPQTPASAPKEDDPLKDLQIPSGEDTQAFIDGLINE